MFKLTKLSAVQEAFTHPNPRTPSPAKAKATRTPSRTPATQTPSKPEEPRSARKEKVLSPARSPASVLKSPQKWEGSDRDPISPEKQR